jgi:hypothetical protein
MDEPVDRKRVRERSDGRIEWRRVAQTLTANAAAGGQRANRTRAGQPWQVAHAGAADEIGAGYAGAQFASLRQRHARGVESASPNAVKCARQKI